jgi:thioredoxin-related protein
MNPAFQATVVAIVCSLAARAAEPVAEAAGIGAWTTDYPAAVKVAAERRLPLFLQFTGSDWCGWCQKMEKECFSKPEFLDAMKNRCVLVVADFPRKIEQTAELKAQNKDLSDRFKKGGGFPRYYMVDADAMTVHWSWGAHPKYGKDLELLVSDIDDFVAGCSGVVERVTKDLPADQAEAYRKAAKAYAEKRQAVAVWLDEKHPDAKAANEQFKGFGEELKTLKAAMDAVLPSPTATTSTR